MQGFDNQREYTNFKGHFRKLPTYKYLDMISMLILYNIMICYVHNFIINIYNIYIYTHSIQIYNPYSFAGCQLARLSRFTRSIDCGIPRLAHAHTGREATRLSQENVALPCLALGSHGMMPHQDTESVCSFLPNRWTPMIYITYPYY